MKYSWDENKNIKNFRKHGVWFEEACTVFSDTNALELFDDKHSTETEDRFILLGLSSTPRLLIVVYCEKGEEETRIISARKATSREEQDYEKRV